MAANTFDAPSPGNAQLLLRVLLRSGLINAIDGIDTQAIGIAATLMTAKTGVSLTRRAPPFSSACK